MTCRLCGGSSSTFESYDITKAHAFWLGKVNVDPIIEIRKCDTHGSLFVVSVPDPQTLASQYPSGGSDPAAFFSGDRSADRKALESLESVRPFLHKGARVLDVGGGDGAFAVAAHRAGYDSWMLEVGDGGFERLRAAGVQPLTVIPPEFMGTFDAVTLWDVYEHVWPHDEFFKPIHAALKRDGTLIFECPKPSHLVSVYRALGHVLPSPRKESAFLEIANYTHVQICTPSEIRATLPVHGFEIVHLETQSSLSYKGVEYAQRIIKPRFLAAAIGGLFDLPLVRRVLLGHNKSFVVARKVSRAT